MNTHYVYRITNTQPTDERKYYIGVRTTEGCSPEEDSGYMSSSKYMKEAIRQQGLEFFSKEILSTWETREQANLEEIRLHKLLGVSTNTEYYNMAEATSEMFCTVGQVTVFDTRDGTTKNVSKEEFEKHDYYIGHTTGQVTVLDAEDGLTKNITVEEYHQNKNRYFTSCKGKMPVVNIITGHKTLMTKEDVLLNPDYELLSATKGMVVVKDIRDNTSKLVTQEEYQTHDYYVATNTGKVNVVDLRDGKTKQVTKEEFDSCDYYQSALVGQVTVIDSRDGLTKNVSKADFDKFEYYTSIMGGKMVVFDTRDNSTKHVTKEDFHKYDYYISLGSKKIGIFNKDGELQHSTYGNFKKYCRSLGLPYNALGESLRNNSNPIPLSSAKNAVTKFINSGYESYIGWYAKEIK